MHEENHACRIAMGHSGNLVQVASACRTGEGKTVPVSHSGRDHRRAMCVECTETEDFVVEP